MANKKEEVPEMEIEGDTFFVVDAEKTKWILKKEEDAIERMKKVVKEMDISYKKELAKMDERIKKLEKK